MCSPAVVLFFTAINDINAAGDDDGCHIVAQHKGLAQQPTGDNHAGNGHEGAKYSDFTDGIVAEQLIINAKAEGRNTD